MGVRNDIVTLKCSINSCNEKFILYMDGPYYGMVQGSFYGTSSLLFYTARKALKKGPLYYHILALRRDPYYFVVEHGRLLD